MTLKAVKDLVRGDFVDLENDKYADNKDYPEFEFQYEIVDHVIEETPTCFVVYFRSGFACGFPPSHKVKVEPNP